MCQRWRPQPGLDYLDASAGVWEWVARLAEAAALAASSAEAAAHDEDIQLQAAIEVALTALIHCSPFLLVLPVSRTSGEASIHGRVHSTFNPFPPLVLK